MNPFAIADYVDALRAGGDGSTFSLVVDPVELARIAGSRLLWGGSPHGVLRLLFNPEAIRPGLRLDPVGPHFPHHPEVLAGFAARLRRQGFFDFRD